MPRVLLPQNLGRTKRWMTFGGKETSTNSGTCIVVQLVCKPADYRRYNRVVRLKQCERRNRNRQLEAWQSGLMQRF